MSSRLDPEMEQKTLHHCSANTLTAGDLGPGLPRSEGGQKEAPQAPFNNPTRIPPSMRWQNESWLTQCEAWPLSTFTYPSIDPLLSLDKHDKSGVYLLKRPRERAKGEDKKQCKINTELVLLALMLLLPVCVTEET